MIKQLDHHHKVMAETIVNLQKSAYTIEATLINYPNLPPLKETASDIQTSNEIFFGYFIENELAGFLSFKEVDACLDIHRLCVSPNYFKRGIAQSLLDFVTEQSNASKMIVATAEKNHPAITFYRKNGFVLQNTQAVDAQLNLVFFEKKL